MAGQRGALLIQSSGLGNTLNALGSLAMAYRLPFPLLVSLRGELGEFNPAQLHMGRAVPGLPRCADHPARHAAVRPEASTPSWRARSRRATRPRSHSAPPCRRS